MSLPRETYNHSENVYAPIIPVGLSESLNEDELIPNTNGLDSSDLNSHEIILEGSASICIDDFKIWDKTSPIPAMTSNTAAGITAHALGAYRFSQKAPSIVAGFGVGTRATTSNSTVNQINSQGHSDLGFRTTEEFIGLRFGDSNVYLEPVLGVRQLHFLRTGEINLADAESSASFKKGHQFFGRVTAGYRRQGFGVHISAQAGRGSLVRSDTRTTPEIAPTRIKNVQSSSFGFGISFYLDEFLRRE